MPILNRAFASTVQGYDSGAAPIPGPPGYRQTPVVTSSFPPTVSIPELITPGAATSVRRQTPQQQGQRQMFQPGTFQGTAQQLMAGLQQQQGIQGIRLVQGNIVRNYLPVPAQPTLPPQHRRQDS